MIQIKWVAVSLVLLSVACGNDDKKKSGDGGSAGSTAWMAAVGDDGTLVQTFDAKNWQTRTLAEANLFSVTCVGNGDGWAVGSAGTVMRTHDGGTTWSSEDAHTSVTLRTVHFAEDARGATPRLVGVTAGDDGTLAISLDGGDHWKLAATGTQSALRSADTSVNADLFVVVGDAGTVLRSADLGASWQLQTLPTAADLTSVSVLPSGGLILASDSAGHVFVSHDLGASFVLEATLEAKLNAVALADDGSRALAVGDMGALARRDGAGQWSSLTSGGNRSLLAVFVDHAGSHDYVAGESGTLLASSDRGQSFTLQKIATSATLRSLEDLGAN